MPGNKTKLYLAEAGQTITLIRDIDIGLVNNNIYSLNHLT